MDRSIALRGLGTLILGAAVTGCASVKASVGALVAANAGIDKGADALMAQLH